MSLAQITEKIRNDAQKEADEILSKAKAQAEAITSKAEKECAGIQEGFDERFGAERPEIIKRREIVADIDVSKMMLSAKRELIEDVYRGTLEKMKALPKGQVPRLLRGSSRRRRDHERRTGRSRRRRKIH